MWFFMQLMSKNELFLLEETVKRAFSAKYKDSVLGIFWSILRPLLMMIVLTIVFSTFFKGFIENYPVYLLAGRCIYDFFVAGINVSMMAIKGNKNILLKVNAPKYIFVLGGIIAEFINFLISLILLICVMIVTKNPFYLNMMPLSIIPIISLILMLLGFGFLVSILCVYYTDILHLWGVVSLFLMYCSAIFYPMDIIPEPFHQYIILNPVYWIIEQFRDFMVYGIMPNTLNIINSLLLSSIIFLFGIIVFKKYEKLTLLSA